ncbi:FadR/GntR family transcriptional regulator [Rhodococcus sp. IEGM 1379]|uniref:FadR/GntR family transcriptional regulator n=1 Tax=Rhodococcus sp. IEGM 1379 TaxID=3047086 RepID=UPI0024B7EF46|nr:FadR/GntR family transcriptional regulator [Rhodococcus sp. IEGM 1379]MDI9915985.1 FadR/GntR family transcriptional regulator [Rhodococcus sp. IEGM 1379]
MTVVRKESAYEQSLDWMRAQIADGSWTVGNRIPTEPELMSVLGVGRNTVREAIKTLTSTGVLEIRRGSGTFVRARTDIGGLLGKRTAVDEMKYVFEVRRALEIEAVRLACDRRTDADVRILRELAEKRDVAVEDFADVDLAFHTAVVNAAHNPVLKDLFAGILETVRATYDVTEGVHPPSLTSFHHREVADAIADRDVDRARTAACGYLEKTQEAIGSGSAGGCEPY